MKEAMPIAITDRTPTKRQIASFPTKPLISLDVGILPSMQLHVTMIVTHIQTENIHYNVLDRV